MDQFRPWRFSKAAVGEAGTALTPRWSATLLVGLAGCSAPLPNGAAKTAPEPASEPTAAPVAPHSSVEVSSAVNLPTASPVPSTTVGTGGEVVTSGASASTSSGAPAEPATSAAWVKRARQHAAAGRWAEVAEAFERAATYDAENAALQAEAGAAWFKAGNLEKAATRNASAYWAAPITDDDLRAQIFYNQGRVEEAQQHPAEARALYQASLTLRSNDTVQRYFDKLASVETRCAKPKDIDSYCRCARAAEINSDTASALFYGVPFQCREVAAISGGRLRVIEHSATESYSPMVIVEQSSEGLSLAYEIGRSFEPGAFGVHNFIEIAGVTIKTVAGHPVATIIAEHHNYDQNQGGLEVFSNGTTEHVLCLLPNDEAIRCPVRVPVKAYSSARYEVDPAADPETQAEQRRRQREDNFEQLAECKYDISSAGLVRVKDVRGQGLELGALQQGVKLW